MADKYVDVSLTTGNNDGTSLADAWQSFTAVMTNTMGAGSITAGDVIHVRTHDGTSDLGETVTSDITVVTPTALATPTTFIFDNGTVWAQGGVFTITCNKADMQFTFHDHYIIEADGNNNRLEFLTNYTGYYDILRLSFGWVVGDGVALTGTGTAYHYVTSYQNNGEPAHIVLKNFKYTGRPRYAGSAAAFHIGNSCLTLINPTVDIALSTGHSDIPCIFFGGITVHGGKLVNARSDTKLIAAGGWQNNINQTVLYGFDTGTVKHNLTDTGATALNLFPGYYVAILDSPQQFDAAYRRGGLVCEYLAGNNQPTLNATLPDGSNTPWSLMFSPLYCYAARPGIFPVTEKFYNQSAGIKTLTLELLVHENYTTATPSNNGLAGVLWAEFSYTDSVTGDVATLSTRVNGGDIPESTASWSALTYYTNTYYRLKLAVTTSTAIKPGSKIYCKLFVAFSQTQTTDFFFVCPDMVVS